MNVFPAGICNMFNNQLNFSYAHAALQSLFCLNSSQELFHFMINNNIRYNMLFPMANELLNIFDSIRSGNIANSQNILFYFGKYYMENKMNIQSQNVLNPDPFHFLYFLLQFLHMETNMGRSYDTSYFNQNLNTMKIDNNIYRLFLQFYITSQNSIISSDMFTTVRYTYKCINCGEYYFYGLLNIFRMKLDIIRGFRDLTYPLKKGSNLVLPELFTCFCGGSYTKCQHCGNNRTARYTRLCFPAKVIIISLERNNHSLCCDVNYPFYYNFVDYISKTKTIGINLNTNYELKAVISYTNFVNGGKYFADCKIKMGDRSHIWVRYVDSFLSIIQPNDIFNHEPQILIYEVSKMEINNDRLASRKKEFDTMIQDDS